MTTTTGMDTPAEFRCQGWDDDYLFHDEKPCNFARTDLRDQCPRHEANRDGLILKQTLLDHGAVEREFTYESWPDFPLENFTPPGYSMNGGPPLPKSFLYGSASVRELWLNGSGSDNEQALVFTQTDGQVDDVRLDRERIAALSHRLGDCSCGDNGHRRHHDDVCCPEALETELIQDLAECQDCSALLCRHDAMNHDCAPEDDTGAAQRNAPADPPLTGRMAQGTI